MSNLPWYQTQLTGGQTGDDLVAMEAARVETTTPEVEQPTPLKNHQNPPKKGKKVVAFQSHHGVFWGKTRLLNFGGVCSSLYPRSLVAKILFLKKFYGWISGQIE